MQMPTVSYRKLVLVFERVSIPTQFFLRGQSKVAKYRKNLVTLLWPEEGYCCQVQPSRLNVYICCYLPTDQKEGKNKMSFVVLDKVKSRNPFVLKARESLIKQYDAISHGLNIAE